MKTLVYLFSKEQRSVRLKMSLVTQIFIAFVIAIILGVVFGSAIDVIRPIGDLFLRWFKFFFPPLIWARLVAVVQRSVNPKHRGRMGIKQVSYFWLLPD